MKFTSGKSVVYVRLKDITSVSMAEWKSRENITEFCVEICHSGGMPTRILTTKIENEATGIQHQIGAKLDEVSGEKTYLDGFKEGTEYALKLIEKKDK